MIYFVILFVEVGLLFLLSKSISKTFSKFMSISFLSFLLLPGVVVHEMSHLLAAVAMFVPVGDMEFVPKQVGDSLKLGSIQIGKTDPIRRSIIGFAPVFLGLLLITSIVYFFTSNIEFLKNQNVYIFTGIIIIVCYLLFAISNTMFSSAKDMEGAVEILITLLVIFGAFYLLGFRPSFSFVEKVMTKEVVGAVGNSTVFLLAPITIDLLMLGAVKFILRGSQNRSS